MSDHVEVFLDDTPGPARGIVRRNGHYEHILFGWPESPNRLGAVSVGRVTRIEPGLGGVFVEIGAEREAFLPLKRGGLAVGRKIQVEVVAETREIKGPTLRMLGSGEGDVRLLHPGRSLAEWLEHLAPGVTPVRGKAAIEAGWAAIQEAEGQPYLPLGPRVTVERTRAMITVDIDHMPRPGKGMDARERAHANRQGLIAAARLIRLRRLGGLVAVDLVGAGHDGGAITAMAKAAFGADREIVYGPVNRFGVFQLSLPWRFTPLDEVLYRDPRSRSPGPEHMALEVVRRLNHALLSDTASPRITARCSERVAGLAGPLVEQLGPRAHIHGETSIKPTEIIIE